MTQTVKHNINPILHLSLNVSQCLKEKDITTHFWYDIMYLIVTKSCKVELAVLFLTFFFKFYNSNIYLQEGLRYANRITYLSPYDTWDRLHWKWCYFSASVRQGWTGLSIHKIWQMKDKQIKLKLARIYKPWKLYIGYNIWLQTG